MKKKKKKKKKTLSTYNYSGTTMRVEKATYRKKII